MDKFTITDSIPGPSTGLKKVLSVIRMDMGVFYMIDPENMPEPLRTALLSCAQSLKTVTPITDEKEQLDLINKLMNGGDSPEHASISFKDASCIDFFSSRLLSLMMGSYGIEGNQCPNRRKCETAWICDRKDVWQIPRSLLYKIFMEGGSD